MPSLIFETAVRYLMPLLLLFSLFILFRGHNEPGGGFIGGLVAACAFSMYMIAFDVQKARYMLRINPIRLIGIGLLISCSAGMMGLLVGYPFLTGLWGSDYWLIIGKPSTPLIFDVGVYLVVIGISLLVIFSLADSEGDTA